MNWALKKIRSGTEARQEDSLGNSNALSKRQEPGESCLFRDSLKTVSSEVRIWVEDEAGKVDWDTADVALRNEPWPAGQRPGFYHWPAMCPWQVIETCKLQLPHM